MLRYSSGRSDSTGRSCRVVSSARLESGQALPADWEVDAAAGDRHGDVGEAASGGSVITNATLRKAMHAIAARNGDFTLFALFMRSDAPGTWDLVVSAPWLEKGKLKATSELVELLSETIGEASLHDFSRIATVGTDHPAVKFILANLAVDDGELRVKSNDLFGLQIDKAIIFRAKEPKAKRPDVRAPSRSGRVSSIPDRFRVPHAHLGKRRRPRAGVLTRQRPGYGLISEPSAPGLFRITTRDRPSATAFRR